MQKKKKKKIEENLRHFFRSQNLLIQFFFELMGIFKIMVKWFMFFFI